MKGFLILVGIALLVSCTGNHGDNPLETEMATDSILHYYGIAKNRNNDLKKRYDAVNKSLRFFKEGQKDTLFSQVLYQKNLILFSLQEYDSLQILNEFLLDHTSKISDNAIFARQYYLMAYYYDNIAHKPENAFYTYSNSENYQNRINDSSWVGKNLYNMAVIQKIHDDFFGSKETITQALKYLNPKKDTKYIASSYDMLATDHRELLNYEEAVKYYGRALSYSTSKSEKLLYQNNLAATFIDYKKYDNAIALLEGLTHDPQMQENKGEYARALDNLAYALWLANKNVKPEAFLHPLKMRKTAKDHKGQIASYTHLGEYYSVVDHSKACTYFDTVVQLSKTFKMPKAEQEALKHLMRLYPKNIALRDRYVFLQDSLHKQELLVKTQFAKYKYDDTLKEESIYRLEKTNAEHALEAANQRNQKVISIASLVLLLVASSAIGYILVQRNKHLQQKNKIDILEATYETEAALSRKLHDDFGAKLNHAMLMLQNGSDPEKVLDIVEVLYDQSRNFSRRINDVDTGPKFKEVLFGMLGTYCKTTKLIVTGSKYIIWEQISATSKKTLYKALQELMTNMQKHSSATMVYLDFEQTKKTLRVDYIDNGKGATAEALQNKNGLWNTEKRIEAINGSIDFETKKGDGFKSHIEIPI